MSSGLSRQLLRDLKTGREAFFDALELESLAWFTHTDMSSFLNPSLGRWRDHADLGFEIILRQLSVETDR